jgi:hypothetical protein
MARELDYMQDIQINEHRLDQEWVNQPQLFMQYAQAAREARAEVDEAKERLKLTEAEVDSHVRQTTLKMTEAAVKAAILQHPRYQEANKQYLEAKNSCEILDVAVEGFHQRKAALENLVRLYGMEYYSMPKAESGDGAEGTKRVTRNMVRDGMRRG